MSKFPFAMQLTRPEGFWVHAPSLDFCKRFDKAYSDCSPPDLNDVAAGLATLVASGPGVCIPSLGDSVSWGGRIGTVIDVDGALCLVTFGRLVGSTGCNYRWLLPHEFEVVA